MLDSIGHRGCKRFMSMTENTLVAQNVLAFRCIINGRRQEVLKCCFLVKRYLYLKNYVTSEGAISQNVVYYRQLSIAPYQS